MTHEETASVARSALEELRGRVARANPPHRSSAPKPRSPSNAEVAAARARVAAELELQRANDAAGVARPPARGELVKHATNRAMRRRDAVPEVERERQLNEAWAKRALERLEPLLETREREGLAFELRLIPRHVWRTCWKIVGDRSGAAARAAWRGVAPLLRVRMLRASLGLYATEFARYRWSDMRARRICALAWALIELSKRGTRRGRWAGGLVTGITRGALCQLLRDPHDDRESAVPSLSALAGTHRVGATAMTGEVGYMVALKEVGFCYSQQLDPKDALPCERWGTYCSARYWLATSVYERAFAELGVDGGALLEFAAGWIADGLKPAMRRLFALPPPLNAS